MRCWNCGASVREGAKLCVYCGTKLTDETGELNEDQPRGRSGARDERRPSPGPGARLGHARRDESHGDTGWTDQTGDSLEAPAYEPPRSRGYRDPGDDRGHRPASRPASHVPARDAYDTGDYGGDTGASEEVPVRQAPAARHSAGSRPRSRPMDDRYDDRYDDPLADPRAPRSLRTPGPSSSRGGSRTFGDYAPRARRGDASAYDDGGDRRGGATGRYDDRGRSAGRGREDYGDFEGYDGARGRSRGGYGDYDARGRSGRSGRDAPGGYGAGGDHRGHAGYNDEDYIRRPALPMEDSWGVPASGREPTGWAEESAAWGVAPSEALPVPAGPRRERPSAGGRAGKSGRAGGRGAPASKGKNRTPFVVLLVIVVLAAIAAGGVLLVPKMLHGSGGPGGSSAPASHFIAYTPGPTPTTVPNYTYFQSDRSGYILNYPKDWVAKQEQSQPGDNVDTFASPQAGVPLVNVERADGFGGGSDDDIIQAEVKGGQQAGNTFTQTTAAPASVAIGGETWTRREYDVTDKSGNKVHMAILACHHAGRGYAVVLISAPADFARLSSTTFQSILTSFRFIG